MSPIIDIAVYVIEDNLHCILGIRLVYPLISSLGRNHSDAHTQSLFVQRYVL